MSEPTRRRMVLIDGANTVYRAFFAIPGLRAPDGSPTNAILGFLNIVNKLVREERPDFVAVAFDPRGGSFRNERYAEYKAGRDATPEDLAAQWEGLRACLEAHRIPMLEVEGFEADDVIATLVEQAPEDVDVSIVSSDKDLMQLVSERVELLDGIKDRRIGPAEVEEKFGVPPAKMLDLRALVGDPSDNIPGVKGIGVKGAAKLISEYGDLEGLLAHAGDVKAKRAREALQAHADEARLSRELSALRTDVDLPVGVEELACREPDGAALAELYRRYGFTRLLEALEADAGEVAPEPAAPVEASVVSDAADLPALADRLLAADACAIVAVVEAGSVVDAPLVGLAFATGEASATYVAVRDPRVAEPGTGVPPEALVDGLGGALGGPSAPRWAAHGAQNVYGLLHEMGLPVVAPAWDVEVAAFLVDSSGAHHPTALARQLLGRALPAWEDVAGRGARAVPASALPLEAVAGWAAEQAACVVALVPVLEERLAADGLEALFREVEMPLAPVLAGMERAGVRIDEEKLAKLSAEYESELSRLEGEIHQLAGEEFLVSSPKQLQTILFEKLKLPALKKTKTGYSTAESVLEQLQAHHELPGRILAWRQLSKLKSTYLDALPRLVSERTGRIHPRFNPIGAATGRMSAHDPNVQNIPIRSEAGIRIREAFVPAEGQLLVSADYSQVELRILAHYSGDETLIAAFRAGEDVHRRTAAEVAGIGVDAVSDEQRARAKAVNFGIIYGSSAFGLANNLGIATGDAQETIDAYFDRYRGVRRFIDETIATAKEEGFVRTLMGRRRYLPDLRSRNRVLRQAAERMAVNSVIQGTAADLIKKAMVEVDAAFADEGLTARMLMQVHDELVFEAPPGEVDRLRERVRGCMEGVFALEVPLVVEVGVGSSWREAH